MESFLRRVFVPLSALLLVSCALPVTQVDIQSFSLEKPGITKDQAMGSLTNILVNRGFDIKLASKEAGLVSTEYKKFASLGKKPPMDYYMQIKARILDNDGKIKISLTPSLKEQNRLNAADFNEHELSYYTGDSEALSKIQSMKEGTGWRATGQILFMNVIYDVAETFGLSLGEITQDITKTPTTTSEAK